MTEAIDGGAVLDKCLWHKFRPPLVHEQADVIRLAAQLKCAWAETLDGPYDTLKNDDFFVPQIEKVIGIFEEAAASHELIISALDYHGMKAPLFHKKFKLAAP